MLSLTLTIRCAPIIDNEEGYIDESFTLKQLESYNRYILSLGLRLRLHRAQLLKLSLQCPDFLWLKIICKQANLLVQSIILGSVQIC